MARFRSISLGIIVTISALLIGANYFTIRLTSAVRAYINGESRYSKGQNDASTQLILFLEAKDSAHWKSFRNKIKIPIGDSIARVALENGRSLDVIKSGFIQGGNHPEDLGDMIWLFRNFRRTSFINHAVQIWKEADFLVGQLFAEGMSAHQKIMSNSFSEKEKKAAIARIDFLLPLLIKKGQEFSDVLGIVARKINRYLLATNIILILIIIGTAGKYVMGTIGAHIRNAAELEKTEAERRQSEIYLRGILDSTTDGILAADSQGKIINSNNRFAELWQVPPRLMERKDDNALLAYLVEQVKDPKWFLSGTQELYHSDKTSLDELEFKDGKIFERASTPLILNHNIVGRVWSFRDITERKEGESALKLAEKNLQLKSFTIEHSSDPIFWIRPDGSFADINPAAYESLGYSLEEMLALKVPDIDFLYNEEVWPSHWEELREKRTLKFPSIQRKKDGTLLHVEIIANYIQFEGQEFNCAIIRDVTERKKSEAALLQQFEELQKINHELDRFVYSVSHDLRAPLASLLGLISIAELEKPSPTFQSYLFMMRQSINRLDGFIKDILDYSRNSRTEIVLEKIDFKNLIAESQNNLRQMSGFDRLRIEVNILENVVFYSDSSRIEILLNNLFSNAIKYLDPQKPSSYVIIDISTSLVSAIIKFSDNGIGIGETHLNRIFEMFYRATEKAKGSGLGLYIARETVSKLKGTITVQSEFEKGTTFEIRIPNTKAIVNC